MPAPGLQMWAAVRYQRVTLPFFFTLCCLAMERYGDGAGNTGERTHASSPNPNALVAFSALTLLVGWHEGHPAYKNMGGWWRWALVSLDGVAPSRMVSVSASVNLLLRHKVQKFSSGTGSPGWSRKNGRKTVVVWWCVAVKQWLSIGVLQNFCCNV